MIEDTPLTDTIRGNPDPESSEETADINYDKAAKIVLSDRRLIAWILKRFIGPYKNLSIEQIVGLITDVSTSSKNTVSPKVEEPDEKHANSREYYRLDLVVTATLPGETEAQFYIGIEHQRDPYPGYYIVVRAVTYVGAMLASEPKRDFPGEKYARLKPAYSFWIIPAPPQYLENTIWGFSMPTKEQLETNLAIPWNGTPANNELWQQFLKDLGKKFEKVESEQGAEEPAAVTLDDGTVVSKEEYVAWSNASSAVDTQDPANDAEIGRERGHFLNPEKLAGLVNAYLICLGDPEKTSDPFLALYDTIFYTKSSSKMRIEQMHTKFDIAPSEDIRKGMDTMYSITEVVRKEYADELEKARKTAKDEKTRADNEKIRANKAENEARVLREQLLAHGIQPAT